MVNHQLKRSRQSSEPGALTTGLGAVAFDCKFGMLVRGGTTLNGAKGVVDASEGFDPPTHSPRPSRWSGRATQRFPWLRQEDLQKVTKVTKGGAGE